MLIQKGKKMRKSSITFEEALIDMVRFYGEDTDRRSCVEGERLYYNSDGRQCAIGRLARPEHEALFRNFDNTDCGVIESVVHEYQKKQRMNGKWISEEEALAELTIVSDATLMDITFLQILHDEDPNWDKDGLTQFGVQTVGNFRPDLMEKVLSAIQKEEFLHQ